MTPQEFAAWFEGFTEAFDRVPSKAQWERVKERVAEIDGKNIGSNMALNSGAAMFELGRADAKTLTA